MISKLYGSPFTSLVHGFLMLSGEFIMADTWLGQTFPQLVLRNSQAFLLHLSF